METTGEEGSKQQKATGTGWEWKTDTQKWVESSGKPPFRIVPDDTKPTLRDPVSTSLSLTSLPFPPCLSLFGRVCVCVCVRERERERERESLCTTVLCPTSPFVSFDTER
jgi:hypothetical protein